MKTQRTKAELLAHYATREPKHFYQFDNWLEKHHDDAIEGPMSVVGGTWELMRGSDVRVLIPDGVTSTEAVAMLRQIIDWIERNGVDLKRVNKLATEFVDGLDY
jgi:hypothetical protein